MLYLSMTWHSCRVKSFLRCKVLLFYEEILRTTFYVNLSVSFTFQIKLQTDRLRQSKLSADIKSCYGIKDLFIPLRHCQNLTPVDLCDGHISEEKKTKHFSVEQRSMNKISGLRDEHIFKHIMVTCPMKD